jgi:hypothetical protein
MVVVVIMVVVVAIMVVAIISVVIIMDAIGGTAFGTPTVYKEPISCYKLNNCDIGGGFRLPPFSMRCKSRFHSNPHSPAENHSRLVCLAGYPSASRWSPPMRACQRIHWPGLPSRPRPRLPPSSSDCAAAGAVAKACARSGRSPASGWARRAWLVCQCILYQQSMSLNRTEAGRARPFVVNELQIVPGDTDYHVTFGQTSGLLARRSNCSEQRKKKRK